MTDKSEALLRGLDKWDAAWGSADPAALRSCLAPDATLHADGVLFENNVTGVDAIADVHTRYFQHYAYKHQEIARAVNPDTNAVFGFWQDADVAHRSGQAPVESPTGACALGIWKLILTGDGSKVKDIHFLRQLHTEEAEHRLKDPSKAAHGGIDPQRFAGIEVESSPERQAASRRAAERYSEMWQDTGDMTQKAQEVLTEDFEEADLTQGKGLHGRQAFIDMINKMADASSGWVSESTELDIGVCPYRNVAFVHWTSVGSFGKGGAKMKSYGLSVLVLHPKDAGRVQYTAGFRQPGPKEREEMLKPDAFAHAPHST